MTTENDQKWRIALRMFEQTKTALDELRQQADALAEVAQCAQAVLTALNVGDVQSGSPLHLKLREVMIAHREKK